MTGTKREYERFLVWLAAQEGVSGDARRVSNMVYTRFDAVEATSHAQAQRSRFLVPQLIRDLEATPEAHAEFDVVAGQGVTQFDRLSSLAVGPFRGFQQEEQFDLDARIVLFYGPNGTGKTSLCEALELCMLGEVAEADSKRIAPDDYLRNVFVDAYAQPLLRALNLQGMEVEVVHDADAFRFCFVEKNRIDAFSRIAARSTARRTELIATLFGLDGFTDFVRGFNQEIDGQLDLNDPHRQLLALRRAALDTDTALVESEAAAEAALSREEDALALEYAPATIYSALLTLLGTSETPGRLQDLEQLLRAPVPAVWGITQTSVADARRDAIDQLARAEELAAQLERRRGEVNFIALYEAVSGLESDDADRCPACDTPIAGDSHVVCNPFDKARKGLAELANVAEIQKQHELELIEAFRISKSFLEKMRKASDFAKTADPECTAALALTDVPPEPRGRWWEVLDEPGPDDGSATKWAALEAAASDAERNDADARLRNAESDALNAERDRLNEFNLKVTAQKTKRSGLSSQVSDARTRIAEFDAGNQPLRATVEEERVRIAHHTRVQAAYGEFIRHLRTYRSGLPALLMADLNDTVRQLYNDFNRSESEADRLALLTLPVDENQRIEVAFNSHPNVLVDALQVMSEGHIRCLGLAILVAKNLKLNCPVLIFDDAVNAIDNEHRIGIRDTLYTGEQFANKQILLTCHGEELIKDIEVVIGRIAAHQSCRSYTFLPHEGDRNIRVISSSTRNYVLEAQQLFAAGRVRDAMASARRAMESINDRTWGLLVRAGQGELKLKRGGPRAPLDQNNLATVLKQALEKDAFVDLRKVRLIAGYEFMLRAREWSVFNILTHEQAGGEDIPRETVSSVIDNLASLDDLLSGHVAAVVA